jgi:hypothetical protein
LFLLALLPSLVGCPAIHSDQPLGIEIAVLKPEAINGTWMVAEGNGFLGFRVRDAQKGELFVWDVSDEEKKPDAPLQCEPPPDAGGACSDTAKCGVLRRTGNFYFGGTTKDGPYRTEVIIVSDAHFYAIVYGVQDYKQWDKRLRDLVANETLPGRVDSQGEVILGSLKLEHYRLLLAQETGLLDLTSPSMVLVKLPDSLDPCKKGEKSK